MSVRCKLAAIVAAESPGYHAGQKAELLKSGAASAAANTDTHNTSRMSAKHVPLTGDTLRPPPTSVKTQPVVVETLWVLRDETRLIPKSIDPAAAAVHHLMDVEQKCPEFSCTVLTSTSSVDH